MFSSNVVYKELVLRSLKASPLIKPIMEVSVGLKSVRTSRVVSFLNLSPLHTRVKESDLGFEPMISAMPVQCSTN